MALCGGLKVLCLVSFLLSVTRPTQGINNRPFIGILGMSTSDFKVKYGDEYILESYVKYLEGAGAQVVPVRGNQSESYYENLFKHINGVLFPGGGDDPMYKRSGEFMFKMAIQANLEGYYFPIWGTCEGFELLTYLPIHKNVLTNTDTENLTLPLNLVDGFQKSRLFKDMPENLIQFISHENLTQNSHHWSLLLQTYHDTKLSEFYQALTTNISPDNKQFVSTIEAKKFPFYATQWHPEKNLYTWYKQNVNHSFHAVELSQYMANFFVNEARKNPFGFYPFAANLVIENYKRIYEPSIGAAMYVFNYHS